MIVVETSIITPEMLPAAAVFHELRSPNASLERFDELFPEERNLVSNAVDTRKAEFADARWCAHRAMQELRFPADGPVLRGERGMPIFPRLVSGSLTHTEGLRAAVVAPSLLVRSLGVDAEPAERLPLGVLEHIARPTEQSRLAEIERDTHIFCMDRVLFCCKETTYKVWFPLTHRYLDFDEADIYIRPDGTFTSYILARPTPVPYIEGYWSVRDGYVVTVASVV